MDRNQLFFRHQIALMDADRVGDHDDRPKFGARADRLAAQIGALQYRLGAHAAPLAAA